MAVEDIARQTTPVPGAAIAAWTVYGMGSSAYLLMIPTIGYATYFHDQVAGDRTYASALWAIAVACALILTGIIAPLLGAHVDAAGMRRRALLLITMLACCLTASLSLVGRGDLLAGTLLFVGAHVAFLLGKALYNLYLPALGAPASLSGISGLSWGLGYVGSIVIFLLCLPFIAGATESSDPATFRLTFLITGGFFAVLSIPSLLLFPPDVEIHNRAIGRASAYARVRDTLRQWRQHREILKFLLAFYLINDAIVTVLFFIGIFFKTDFGLSVETILKLTLLFYAVGIPATIGFGWLGRMWSERGALYVTLAIWLVLLGLMALARGPAVPLASAVIAGLVIGSTQALCRSIYARMIPAGRSSEFFGFNALVGRASAALGPLVFGTVSAVSGSQRAAMASLGVFIVLGGVVLVFLKPVGR